MLDTTGSSGGWVGGNEKIRPRIAVRKAMPRADTHAGPGVAGHHQGQGNAKSAAELGVGDAGVARPTTSA
ncbi:MAG: hypothetical protein ACE10G_01515 [Gemmatimonadales bacterium]